MALFINQSTYLPKYQPTHIPTFKPTQLPTKLSTNIPAYPSKNLTTYQQIHLPNNLPTRDNLPTYITKNQPTNQKSNLQIYLPTYLSTNQPTYLPDNCSCCGGSWGGTGSGGDSISIFIWNKGRPNIKFKKPDVAKNIHFNRSVFKEELTHFRSMF